MSPETYENDVFQNKTKTTYKKNRIQYTYNNKTNKRNLEATLNC